MATKRKYIFTVENPYTKEPTTFLISSFVDQELIDKYVIESFDGEYQMPSQFEAAIDEDHRIKDSKRIYNILAFYPAGFTEFIEKLQKLTEV